MSRSDQKALTLVTNKEGGGNMECSEAINISGIQRRIFKKDLMDKKQEKSLFYLATFSLSNTKQLIKSQPITNLIQHNQKVQVCKLHKC